MDPVTNSNVWIGVVFLAFILLLSLIIMNITDWWVKSGRRWWQDRKERRDHLTGRP